MTETELSPAERFRQAKIKRETPAFDDFTSLLKYPLDTFQEQACRELAAGKGVLVAAPTGAGKTVIGEFAIHLAIAKDLKVF